MQIEKTDPQRELPWTEKYRPARLDELLSNERVKITLDSYLAKNYLPNMLFYGSPGTGKTSTILAAAKQLYGPAYRYMVLELNASDDRGINVVRKTIKNFAESKTPLASNIVQFKLVILDESDSMTRDAQAALRRMMEKFARTTRFCLICNYVG